MTPTTSTVIVDLGDVLVSWNAPPSGRIKPKSLRRAMNTSSWFEFEQGLISQIECYTRISKFVEAPVEDIEAIINEAQASLRVDNTMLEALASVKANSQGQVRLCLMSNIAKPHWDIVKVLDCDWSIFDHIFISGIVGMRKPDLCFYQHVLKETGLAANPSSAVFIDDKLENVYSAKSLGIQGIVFDTAANVLRQLHNMVGGSVSRGQHYMVTRARKHETLVKTACSQETAIDDNFAQLLILEATGNRDLVQYSDYNFTWNYCRDTAASVTLAVANDFDTTALALTVLKDYQSLAVMNNIMDFMLTFRSADGLVLVYEDRARPRVDPVCSAHIFTLYHLYGRSGDIPEVWTYFMNCLKHRAYIGGSYYYEPSEYLLFSLSRLIKLCKIRGIALPETPCSRFPEGFLLPLFAARCRERLNRGPADALSLALRIIACKTANISDAEVAGDVENLKSL